MKKLSMQGGERTKASACRPQPRDIEPLAAAACSLRLVAQDAALSRRKQGFKSPRERQLFQQLRLSRKGWCPVCVRLMGRPNTFGVSLDGPPNLCCRTLLTSKYPRKLAAGG